MTPPPLSTCERNLWVTSCPKVDCPNRLHNGKLCARTVSESFLAGDIGEARGMERTWDNIGWSLGLDGQVTRKRAEKAMRKLRVLAEQLNLQEGFKR